MGFVLHVGLRNTKYSWRSSSSTCDYSLPPLDNERMLPNKPDPPLTGLESSYCLLCGFKLVIILGQFCKLVVYKTSLFHQSFSFGGRVGSMYQNVTKEDLAPSACGIIGLCYQTCRVVLGIEPRTSCMLSLIRSLGIPFQVTFNWLKGILVCSSQEAMAI